MEIRTGHGRTDLNRQVLVFGAVMVAILVGAIVGSYGYYSTITQIKNQNEYLRAQLDQTAEKLRDAQEQQDKLQKELNQTRTQIAELQVKIQQLEQNITDLRQQLEDKALRNGAITVGLTVLWNPTISDTVDVTQLHQIVDYMNKVQWAKFHIYFWLYHAEPRDFMSKTDSCSSSYVVGSITWAEKAWFLFPGRDIPIGIFADVDHNKIWGCEFKTNSGSAISVYFRALYKYGSQVLSHELLHVYGFSDEEIDRQMGHYVDLIPLAWLPRIQAHAKGFQIPLPDDYAF